MSSVFWRLKNCALMVRGCDNSNQTPERNIGSEERLYYGWRLYPACPYKVSVRYSGLYSDSMVPTTFSPYKQELSALEHSSSVLTSNKLSHVLLYCLACLRASIWNKNQIIKPMVKPWAENIHSLMIWAVRNNVTTCRLESVYFLCWIYRRIT